MAGSVFWLDPEAWGSQIGVATASVFSLITFLIGMRSVVPPVEYLNRLDKLVFAFTALIFLAVAEVIVTSRLAQENRAALARRMDRCARVIYPVLLVFILVVTLFL
jgi:hypothetical protein